MATVADLIDRAFAKSDKNSAVGEDAAEPELYASVTKIQRKLWIVAARVNPAYFGKRAVVEWNTELLGWPLPTGHEATARIETEAGIEVVEVDMHDRMNVEKHLPAVYSWGRTLFRRGLTHDPAADTDLVLFYTDTPEDIVPPDPGEDAPYLDERWPSAYDELFVLALAMDLALKDSVVGRDAERQALQAEFLDWFAMFVMHVETTNARRRFAPQPMTQQRLMGLAALFTGGQQ